MKKVLRTLLIFLLIVIGLIALIPLFFPLPPLADLSTAESLAEDENQFIEVNGLKIHLQHAGSGKPPLVLLHGFAASTFSWNAVFQPLAADYQVIAYDRTGFGLSARPLNGAWNGPNPYSMDAQVELLVALMDAKGIDQAVLVGNSAGGSVAVAAALKYPQRVRALVLVDAAIYSSGGLPNWLKPLLSTPQGRWFGPLLVRQIEGRGMELLRLAWHDADRIPTAWFDGYRKPLRMPAWDQALWEHTLAQQPSDLAGRLSQLKMPVLVMTGDDDRIVPTEQSLRLAREIPGAQLKLIQFCGHVPQEECPQEFMQSVRDFLQALPSKEIQ